MQSQSKTSMSQKLLILKHALHALLWDAYQPWLHFLHLWTGLTLPDLLCQLLGAFSFTFTVFRNYTFFFLNCNWTLQLVCIVCASYYRILATMSETERTETEELLAVNGDRFIGEIISLMNTSLLKICVTMISVTHNVYSHTEVSGCVCICVHDVCACMMCAYFSFTPTFSILAKEKIVKTDYKLF